MVKTTLLFIIFFIIGGFISYFIPYEDMNVLLSNVVFNGVSILIGLAIGVYGIFLTSFQTFSINIIKSIEDSYPKKIVEEIKKKQEGLVKELKSNALFILYSYIIIILFMFFKKMNLPIKIITELKIFDKIFLSNTIIIMFSLAIFYVIIDITKLMFIIYKGIIDIELGNKEQ